MLQRQIGSLFLLIIGLGFASAQWRVDTLGKGQFHKPFHVVVGDARGDGIRRVYVTTDSGPVTEWRRQGSSWSSTVVSARGGHIPIMVIAKTHGDGLPRLYWTGFGNGDDEFVEASWNGSKWVLDTILANIKSLSLYAGVGRNDGKERLYLAKTGVGAGLLEYSWNGTSFDSVRIHSSSVEGSGIIGDVVGDGLQHLVANSSILQLGTWNGSKYSLNLIDSTAKYPDPVTQGDPIGDGINKIYVNGSQGRLQYAWNGVSWSKTILDPKVQRGDLHMAQTYSNGRSRLYTTFSGKPNNVPPAGPLREYSWVGGVLDSTKILDGISGATAMLGSGSGRNDDTVRLYAPNYQGGFVYELTSPDPYVVPASVSIKNREPGNNVWLNGRNLLKWLEQQDRAAVVTLYDLTGKILMSKPANEWKATDIHRIMQGLHLLQIRDHGKTEVFPYFVEAK